MASDHINRHPATILWLCAAISTACAAGWCFASQMIWHGAAFSVCSATCGYMLARAIGRLTRRIRYIIDTALSGDFSYKFPTVNVSKEESDINRMLNQMVEHLEKLSAEARQNDAFLSWVINLTDIGIAVANEKGYIRHHNKAALRMLGRAALTHICQIDTQAMADISIKKSEVMLHGEKYTVITISDLTLHTQAVEVESWEKLIRVLTHEIMNSLTPIQSIAETMRVKAPENELAEAFDTISSSSRSLMRFVQNFRKFSLLPTPQMAAVYIKPLLEKCSKITEPYISEREAGICTTCFPPDLMAYTDEALLSLVIINILKNASEANPKSIRMEADVRPDESVEIRISNDGDIIDNAIAGEIFTPFFTTKPGGSGIGLSLSRRIMAHLGGTLTLHTTPETCFVIRI